MAFKDTDKMQKKNIYVRVLGGIGNQLFIYAFARSISLKYNCKIYFDVKTGFLKDNYKRTSKLSKYVSNMPIASQGSIVLFYFTKIFPKISQLLFESKVLLEPDARELFDVSSEILDTKNAHLFIQGYFQSNLYFEEFATQIKKDIKIDFLKTELVSNIAKKITSSQSVSIHVRRIAYDNLLEIKYYLDAIDFITKKIESPLFFVFSDDIDWCKTNFSNKDNFVFIMHDIDDEIADFWLMTLCKHHIIANSSFSWWGAWLSNNLDKKVVCPQKTDIGVALKIYPSEWILI